MSSSLQLLLAYFYLPLSPTSYGTGCHVGVTTKTFTERNQLEAQNNFSGQEALAYSYCKAPTGVKI